MNYLPQKPHKCDCGCRLPIWRFIDGRWVCLNGQLYQAIHENKDDVARDRLYKLMDSTRGQVVK